MKSILFLLVTSFVLFSACNEHESTGTVPDIDAGKPTNDTMEIKNALINAMKWAESRDGIDLLPLEMDAKDSFYVGFDMEQHRQNIKTLEQTGFFAKEFLYNYDKIILALDEKMKNNTIEKFPAGEYPPFNFSSDVNTWCLCQDSPENPWDNIKFDFKTLTQDKADLTWAWGEKGWEDFSYKVKAVKENGKWKIAYLQGFDFIEATK